MFALLEHRAPTKILFNNTYAMLYLKTTFYFCCVQYMKLGCFWIPVSMYEWAFSCCYVMTHTQPNKLAASMRTTLYGWHAAFVTLIHLYCDKWTAIWYDLLAAEFCPELSDPIGGTQMCKDWGSGGQFKVCEIACNAGSRFSRPVPKFYTCGAEGFWRPTSSPNLPLVYPACTSKYVFLVMQF